MTVRILLLTTAIAVSVGAAAAAVLVHKPAHVSLVAGQADDKTPITVASTKPGSPGEVALRTAIYDRVEQLMVARNYVALDAMEEQFRTGRDLTPGGVPKLYEFHASLQRTFGNPSPSSDCRMAGDQILGDWEKAAPDSPAIYITEAAVAVKRAWCWRGDGYGSAVSAENGAKFQAYLGAAEAILTEHKAVAAQDPEYYSVMEDVYKGQGRDRSEFEALVAEGAGKDPYYYPIYWGAYYYNMPQWYGSAEDVDAAARDAVTRTRARDGLGAYARYYWRASQDDCGCWKDAVDWPSMKQAMRDVAKRYPDPWNLANFAKLSCDMNDGATARAYFTALGRIDGAEAWQKDRAGWQQCRSLAGL